MSQITIQKYSSFLAHLRQIGFVISTGHYLQLQAVLNLAGDAEPSDLKYLLCPVFAKSEKQQAQFYLAFDSFFVSPVRKQIADKDNSELKQEPEMPRKWQYAVFGILLLANVVLYYLAQDDIRFAWKSLTSKGITVEPPVKPPKPPPDPTNVKDTPSPPDKPQPPIEKPKEQEKTFYEQYWDIIRWTGILASIFLFLLTEWYRYDRRKLILQRESSRKPPYFWELNIEAPDIRFLKNEQFYTTARLLRQRLKSDILIPDMEKTVKETIASAGFPKFCRKSLTKPPEYLILIDLPTHRDHCAFRADQTAAALKSEDIFVKRYFYENSPQICFGELTQERVYLSDLQAKFPESRLIVFGNGEEMLDPLSGELESWTEIFHTWQDRAILTRERPQHWGMREITLAKQFIVLPDTPEGLTELARHFDAASLPDLKRWHEEDAEFQDIAEDRLHDAKALQEYLGEDAFQWLCACAVYPELHWNLTLYLGMSDKKWLTEDNLLKLIRLPWFRKGIMPDTLRWDLIVALDKEKNQAIREAIVKMLEKNPPSEDSHAYNGYSLHLAMQKWMLGKKSRKEKQETLKTLRQADEKEVVRDYTFLRFLESVPNSPLTFVLPKALRKMLYKNGVPMFGFKTGIRLMMTALCVVLVLMKMPSPDKTVTNSLGMKFVRIPAGSFMMGSPEDEPGRESDEIQHRVTLTQDFYMQTTEVTQGQWQAVMGENPSYFKNCGTDCPVESVSWDDVQEFIKKLNQRGEGMYRLPTEAEWEYGARAGSQQAFANGDISKTGCEHDSNLDAMGWYCGNSGVTYEGCYNASSWGGASCAGTHPVAQKNSNSFGLYDMHGNVWEWCQDWYGDYTNADASAAATDPAGAASGSIRVLRGGSWSRNARYCRAALRYGGTPGFRNYVMGFRLVRFQGQQPGLAGTGG